LNESFADFSEVLWEEHKYGKDAGDEHNFQGLQTYLYSNGSKKDLVRFYYQNREEVFDAVSYQKGGRILNMLRNYVGEDAFFKSLKLFLTTYKFKAVEAQQLRLAFEEITGWDLNWFWNQWFYGSGHPVLDISYGYDQASRTAKVFVKQTQPDKVFRLPVAIDVYQGSNKKRYNVWVENQADTFAFPADTRPDLINFDGDKILLCKKTDHKTLDNYLFQYKNAGLYLDRREAIDYAALNQVSDPVAFQFLKDAISDRSPGLRIHAIQQLNLLSDSIKGAVEPLLARLAENEPVSIIRASAIEALARLRNPAYRELFLKSVNDSSYSVAGNALNALGSIDSSAAYSKAKELSAQHIKGDLSRATINILYKYASESEFDSLASRFDELPLGNSKFSLLQPFAGYLKKVKDPGNFMKGIDMIVRFRDTIPEAYAAQIRSYINGMVLYGIATAKEKAGLTVQAAYVKSKISGKAKEAEGPVLSEETLRRYTGEYDYEGETIRVTLKDNKILNLAFPGQPEMELAPISSTKFSVKFMQGYTVEFQTNDNNEVTSLSFTSADEEIKATRKNQ
jgi:aminopeptidase N